MAIAAAWYGLVGKANGRARTLVFPFRRRWQKSYVLFYNEFSDMIFYPRVLCTTKVSGIETIPAIACLVALMIWHSCYRAYRPLKSVVQIYISLRINFCLYIVCFDWLSFYQDSQQGMKTVLVTNMCSTLLKIGCYVTPYF